MNGKLEYRNFAELTPGFTPGFKSSFFEIVNVRMLPIQNFENLHLNSAYRKTDSAFYQLKVFVRTIILNLAKGSIELNNCIEGSSLNLQGSFFRHHISYQSVPMQVRKH